MKNKTEKISVYKRDLNMDYFEFMDYFDFLYNWDFLDCLDNTILFNESQKRQKLF